jgi:uncharacterized protein YegL
MKDNLTELVFILDMSGSMQNLTEDTIGGYNSLLDEQKKQDGDAIVTTILFDDRYIVLHDRVPIKDVKPLTNKEYKPVGMTAMLDAVGKTINSVGQKLADTKEEDRPGTVIVTIITDGMENSSIEYTWNSVQEMIKHQREKYSWIFTFIGANIDVMKVSSTLGIDSRMAKSYKASKKGTAKLFGTMASTVSYARKARSSSEDCETVMNEMSSIMDEIESED